MPSSRRNHRARIFGLVSILLAGSMLIINPVNAETAARPFSVAQQDPPTDSDEPPILSDKVDADLTVALDTKGSADFYIDFADHADLAAASSITDWADRGAAVVKTLQATADASQAEVRKQLDAEQVSYTSFWIANTILVRSGSIEIAQQAVEQADVEAIRAPETYEIPEPTIGIDEQQINAVEWGIDRINADDVWSTLGVRGEGIVVGSIDTGVNFQHPALAAQYRGNSGGEINHDYNWFDPSNVCAGGIPCDNNNHGTHTMGTMVGGDGGANNIGVAPGARWIAAKGCESNTCSDRALLESGQWMLAPTRLDGSGADPAQRPQIINNSWGGPGGNSWYSQTIDAWRAAGIFPAFSGGNSGPACGSAGSPGDDEQAFASGSFDINNVIASTSGRGRVGGAAKPDLAAPGVNVRSSIANGGYGSLSGTSMASPHTAGTVALIWAAAPTLQGDIDRTMAVLNETAVDTENLTCGGTAADNNVWGEGRLDALAAVNLARLPVGTVTGHVTDAVSGRAIAGTRVVVSGPFERTSGTGSEGEYSFVLPVGDYTVTASAFGYRAEEATVTVREGETAVQDLLLSALPSGAVSGIVSSTFGPVGNATVTIDGTPIPATTTGADGRYAFAAVPTGNYRMTVTAGGCLTSTTVDLAVNGDTTLDVALPLRADGYGYTCLVEGAGYVEGDTALSLVGDDASAEIALPFPFFFYGATYSRAFVSTNGHLNFLAPSTILSNVAIPATGVPNAAIYPLWDDLVVQNPGKVWTKAQETAPNRSFIIEWRNVYFFNTPTVLVDFEVQLNEDGSIVTRYRNLGADPRERGNSATVGIENAAGTVGLQYSFNSPVLTDDQSIRFVPPTTGTIEGRITDANDGQGIAGATVRALQGTTAVSSVATGADGIYSMRQKLGAYTVEAGSANYQTRTAPVDLVSNGQVATIHLALATAMATPSASSLSFLANDDQLRTTKLTLANPSTSGVTLTWSLSDGQSWLWTVPATGSIPPGGTATLTVRADASGVPGGVNSGAISIKSNAGRNPTLDIPVTLVVPKYRQGVNAGGTAYVDGAGDPWSADQAWAPGGFGYLGAGWVTTTKRPIAGTEDDQLHQTLRESTSGYRFDNLPAGTYVVEMNVSEPRPTLTSGRRVFDVWANGRQVIAGYDPVAAVGTLALDHREFEVTVVEGGAIAIDFGAIRGKLPPIVTSVRVTHRPDR